MTLYAFVDRDKHDRLTTNVCAATTQDEFKDWIENVTKAYIGRGSQPHPEDLFDGYRMTNLMESLRDPSFKGLKYVRVFAHFSDHQQKEFITKHGIEVTNNARCIEFQDWMYNGHPASRFLQEDPYLKIDEDKVAANGGKITIADIIGEPMKTEKDETDVATQLAKGNAPANTTANDPSGKTTIGGGDSLMGVIDVRRNETGTNIIATYRPQMVKTVRISQVMSDCKMLGIKWQGGINGKPDYASWNEIIEDTRQSLAESTDGEYFVANCHEWVRFAVPERHTSILTEHFPGFPIEDAKRSDFTWDFDYLTEKQVAETAQANVLLEQATEQRTHDRIEAATSSLSEESDLTKAIKTAAEQLAREYTGKVQDDVWQDAIARACTETTNPQEMLVKAREILEVVIHGKPRDPNAPDVDKTWFVCSDRTSDLGLSLEYMPEDLANYLMTKGVSGKYVPCYDYPLDAPEADHGLVVVPITDFEVSMKVNLQLVGTMVTRDGVKTALYRKRDMNAPAYLVMYCPGKFERRFELLRILRG